MAEKSLRRKSAEPVSPKPRGTSRAASSSTRDSFSPASSNESSVANADASSSQASSNRSSVYEDPARRDGDSRHDDPARRDGDPRKDPVRRNGGPRNGGGERRIALDEVALHRFSSDFWTVIHNVVYDMSDYAPSHPGGPMILSAAGTDGTVMFEQYHVLSSEQRLESLLAGRRIGVLDCADFSDDATAPARATDGGDGRTTARRDDRSPNMGAMYPALRKGVVARLRGEPARPLLAQTLFFVDVTLMSLLICAGFFLDVGGGGCSLPLLTLLFFVAHAAPPILLRAFGQSHALGHLHVFPPQSVVFWRRVMLAVGAPGIGLATHPEPDANPRRKMNESRLQSQTEFLQKRGPAEHQSVHHVRGAELEHDECLHVASLLGATPISGWQKHIPLLHNLQKYWLHRALGAIASDVALATSISLAERVALLVGWLGPQGLLWDGVAALVGIGGSLCVARAHLLLVFSGASTTAHDDGGALFACLGLGSFSWPGCLLWLAGFLVKHALVPSHSQLFFAQHVWNCLIPEHVANRDWARSNARTSASLRGVGWHPVAWGNTGGSTPSTVTFHLEHTLFPGVNYLHLPKIAGVIDEVCAEHGVDVRVVSGCDELAAFYKKGLAELADGAGGGGGESESECAAARVGAGAADEIGNGCGGGAKSTKSMLRVAAGRVLPGVF